MHNVLKSICDHFSFKDIPFLGRSKVPFENENIKKNMPFLSTAFYSRQLITITGAPGAGKTSMLFYAINELEPSNFRVCHIELSNPNKKALYKALAVKMGLEPTFNADDIKLQIIDFLREENEQGKFNCIIIDEGHNLSIPMIDELRSFYDEGSNFSLILAGLPPLLTRTMSLSVNQPMKQRINISIELEPMTLSTTKEYILHQLSVVQASVPVFDEKCYPVIHSCSAGIPRRINQLCYRVLFDAYLDKKNIISSEYVKEIIDKSPNMFAIKAID